MIINDFQADTATFLCGGSFEYDHEQVRKSFSSLWEDFMKLGHKDFEIYKRILIIIHDKVMPNLLRSESSVLFQFTYPPCPHRYFCLLVVSREESSS